MTLSQLYEQYGKLAIQAEIVNGQLLDVKQKIAGELNRAKSAPEAEKKEE